MGRDLNIEESSGKSGNFSEHSMPVFFFGAKGANIFHILRRKRNQPLPGMSPCEDRLFDSPSLSHTSYVNYVNYITMSVITI